MGKRWWLSLIFTWLIFLGGKGVTAEEQLISSFETEEDIAKWERTDNVILERSTERVTDGKYSLKATFLNNGTEWPYLTLKYPNYSSKDFSKYKYLAMDVYYPKRLPEMIGNDCIATVSFSDSQGNSRPGWVPLVASDGKKSSPKIALFLGIGQLSDKVKFSFSDIVSFSITMKRPSEDFTVFIDNMRLVPETSISEEKPEVTPVSPVSLEQLARFRSLRVLYLGKIGSRKEDLAAQFQTVKVLLDNQVNFDIGVPHSIEELKQYDIVVFDDFSIKDLIPFQLTCIKQFYDEGGAVVMLGGRNSFAGTNICPGYQNTPIEDVLPVKLISSGMHKVVNYYLKLNVEQAGHPVMKELPWMDGFVFAISDANPEDVDGYTRGIEAKEGTEILAAELGSNIPIIVLGERSLIFNLEPRLINHYFPYDFWKRFIIQCFNYLAKDKSKDNVVLAKIDMPSILPLDSGLIEGNIYVLNLGSTSKDLKGEVNYLSYRKEIEFNIKGKELKDIKFSIPTQPLEIGSYSLFAKIENPNRDSFSQAFSVESSLSLKNILSVVVFCKNKAEDLAIKIKNIGPEEKSIRLEVWIEKGKEKVKNLIKEEIKAEREKEVIFNYSFKPDITEGRYKMVSYIYEGEKLLSLVTDEIRIIEESIPFLKRDIDFRIRGESFAEKGILPLEKLLSLEEDIGARRSDEFTMELIGAHMVHIAGEGMDGQFPSSWEDYIAALHKLYQTKIPFVIAPCNLWGTREKYEDLVENMGRMIRLGCDIGKEYFVGLRMSESEAIPFGYVLFGEKETNLEKVDAFVNFISKLVKDIGLPDDKLLFLDVSFPIPYEWGLACKHNVVTGQAFLPIVPIELSYGSMRGMSRSFNKWWEWEITRWPVGPTDTVPLYFDPKTGRPTTTVQQVHSYFLGLPWAGHEGFAGDVHKMYLTSYYNGAKGINAYSENPYEKTQKEAIENFLKFIRENPRSEEIISPIAVVKSKGSLWELPSSYAGHDKRQKTLKEGEQEFLYLDTFFPRSSDDGLWPRYWWTGTPYGAVDLIYPEMKLKDIKKYNSIIFLGYHRMDSVRPDFLDDLMTYVKEGGVVLLSVDQLRNIQGKIEKPKLALFLGASIEDNFPLPPKERIKEYIEIAEETPFKLEKKRYPVTEEKIRIHTVIPDKAEVVAADSQGNPVLLLNKYGEGYVFLFTSPILSTIPPAGKSLFVSHVMDRIAQFKPLPISIFPVRDDVEFLISKTEDKEATIFIMNHGEKDWSGDIIINLNTADLSPEIANNIKAKIGTGYDVKEISPEIKRGRDSLLISGITLSGDKGNFCSYRQASFAYIRLGVK